MCSGKNEKRAHLFFGKLMCELKLEMLTKVLRALGNRNHLNHDGVDCNKIGLGNLHMQIIMVHIFSSKMVS